MKFLDILLVEDDEDLLRFLHNSLVRAGYNVVSVKDAESALDELKLSNFRVLITDIKLPQMDGITLVQSLPPTMQNMAVVFITGFNAYEVDAKNLFPENTVLPKPFHLKALISKIDEIYSKQISSRPENNNDDMI